MEFFIENWIYLIIPVTSGLVGWLTNVLALRMTFYPLEFKGIPPYLGWQGIIPAKAGVMAGKAVDLITKNLVKIEDQFQQIEIHRLIEIMSPELERVSKKIIEEVMNAQAPALWERLPVKVRNHLHQRVIEELPVTVEALMREINNNIGELFDLRTMVVDTLIADKGLLNKIFIKCGASEFKFIERSGAYFGFLFGLIQMFIWNYFQPWWFLPLAGLVVGFSTNWLALKLIFKPEKSWKFGSFEIQGLFIKRQNEVSAEYSAIIAGQILTSPRIFDSIFYGNRSGHVTDLIKKHVSKVVDLAAGSSLEIIQLVAGTRKYKIIKNIAYSSFKEDLRIVLSQAFSYTEQALDLENTLRSKMQALPPRKFASFLHPIFEEDELKLIAVGAFLGGLAGLIQLYLFF
ncbi:MAG: hypothetical protein DHS20C17_09410 [Cyclobacteriaceae bacterium]|nr:MAG: hypothetical protein DHS20C17_09410 [Cyclobacteriaceae bacterium]